MAFQFRSRGSKVRRSRAPGSSASRGRPPLGQEPAMAEKNIEGSQSARGSQPQAGAAAAAQASSSQSTQPGQETQSSQGAREQQAGRGSGSLQRRSPAVEMFERDGQLVIRADLPGLSPDDVRIEVSDDSLVIEGERRSEIEVEDEGVYRAERTYGRFSRVIALPDDVDPAQAQARFENGVLEISIPLPEQTQRRRIPIQGASASEQQQPGATGPVH